LPDVSVPIGKNAAADISLIREVETEVFIGSRLEIEKVQALRIEASE
jgi:hypothetical protein